MRSAPPMGRSATIGRDGICALFGLEREPALAARRALEAAAAIERVSWDLDNRLGRRKAIAR